MQKSSGIDMSEFEKRSWRFSILIFILLAVFTALLILIGYKTDIMFRTDIYGLKADSHYTDAAFDGIYSSDFTDLYIKNFSIEGEMIRVDIGIVNNGGSTFSLAAKDISLVKYVDNKRDIDMIYYPDNYDASAAVNPGETGSLHLEFDVIRLEDKSSRLTYCIDINSAEKEKDVVFVCYDSYINSRRY